MMTHRLLATFVACLALDAFQAAVADAQTRPAYTRGSTKVRSRIVNPFDVSSSGLSVDRFGIVRYQPRARAAFVPETSTFASTAALAAALAPAAPVAATTVSSPVASASSNTVADDSPPPAASDIVGYGSSVRLPYRPPVRSPFRPPPRPPF